MDAEIIDEDEVDIILNKGKTLWQPTGTCMVHSALLLCNTANQSTVIPPASPQQECVFLATVVWVTVDQAQIESVFQVWVTFFICQLLS